MMLRLLNRKNKEFDAAEIVSLRGQLVVRASTAPSGG
jgi:hypothetical protein